MIDPRVRWLAYTLKRWVKARHLNDPSDSTLSSYGLLLLLFHFLQTRSPPILPNLQKMQPSWPSTPLSFHEARKPPKLPSALRNATARRASDWPRKAGTTDP